MIREDSGLDRPPKNANRISGIVINHEELKPFLQCTMSSLTLKKGSLAANSSSNKLIRKLQRQVPILSQALVDLFRVEVDAIQDRSLAHSAAESPGFSESFATGSFGSDLQELLQ